MHGGALPRTARALQGSPTFTILGGLASRNCSKALSCAERVCWVTWSKDMHLAVFSCVGAKNASQLTSYTSARAQHNPFGALVHVG